MSYQSFDIGKQVQETVICLPQDNERIKAEHERAKAKANSGFDRWQLAQQMPQAPEVEAASRKAFGRETKKCINSNLAAIANEFGGEGALEPYQTAFNKRDARQAEVLNVAQWLSDPEGKTKKAAIWPPLYYMWASNASTSDRGRVFHLLQKHSKLIKETMELPPYTAAGHPHTPMLRALYDRMQTMINNEPVLKDQYEYLHRKSFLQKRLGSAGRLVGALGAVGVGALYALGRGTPANAGTIVAAGAAYVLVNPDALLPAVEQMKKQVGFANLPLFRTLTQNMKGPGGAEIMRSLASKQGSEALRKLRIRSTRGKVHPLTDEEFADVKKILAPNNGDPAHIALRNLDRKNLGFLLSVMQGVRARPQAIDDVATVVANGVALA